MRRGKNQGFFLTEQYLMNIVYFGDLKGDFMMASDVYLILFSGRVQKSNADFKHSSYITVYRAAIFLNGRSLRLFLV
jgi:hypothetical protein